MVTQFLTRRSDHRHQLKVEQAAAHAALQDTLWARREELYIDFFAFGVPLLTNLTHATHPTFSKLKLAQAKAAARTTGDQEARMLAFGSNEAVAVTREFVEAVYRWAELAATLDRTEDSLRTRASIAHEAFDRASKQLRKEIVEHYR
ncbi:hypothetical protein C1A38_16585 [Verrucosispora sp. ts21]|nr:hypothetical protein C1A38_16585 [Verrucosispora sp. ts21]